MPSVEAYLVLARLDLAANHWTKLPQRPRGFADRLEKQSCPWNFGSRLKPAEAEKVMRFPLLRQELSQGWGGNVMAE